MSNNKENIKVNTSLQDNNINDIQKESKDNNISDSNNILDNNANIASTTKRKSNSIDTKKLKNKIDDNDFEEYKKFMDITRKFYDENKDLNNKINDEYKNISIMHKDDNSLNEKNVVLNTKESKEGYSDDENEGENKAKKEKYNVHGVVNNKGFIETNNEQTEINEIEKVNNEELNTVVDSRNEESKINEANNEEIKDININENKIQEVNNEEINTTADNKNEENMMGDKTITNSNNDNDNDNDDDDEIKGNNNEEIKDNNNNENNTNINNEETEDNNEHNNTTNNNTNNNNTTTKNKENIIDITTILYFDYILYKICKLYTTDTQPIKYLCIAHNIKKLLEKESFDTETYIKILIIKIYREYYKIKEFNHKNTTYIIELLFEYQNTYNIFDIYKDSDTTATEDITITSFTNSSINSSINSNNEENKSDKELGDNNKEIDNNENEIDSNDNNIITNRNTNIITNNIITNNNIGIIEYLLDLFITYYFILTYGEVGNESFYHYIENNHERILNMMEKKENIEYKIFKQLENIVDKLNTPYLEGLDTE